MQTDLEDKQQRLLTEPVGRLVCDLAVPSIIIMLITSIYNLADTYFVSGLGTSATAAVGVIFSLMGVIQAIGFFFGHGSGNFMSRKFGAKEYDKAQTMASTAFFLSIIFGLIVTVTGLIFMRPLLMLLGSSETMMPYARDYMTYILIAAPFMTASFCLNNQLRYLASAKIAMAGMVMGAVLNIIADPILIYGLNLGVKGAGISTMISQMVTFIILLWATFQKGNIPMKFSEFKISKEIVFGMINGGLPSFIRQTFNSFGVLIFNHTAGEFGDAAVAAISIVQRCTMFAISILLGFGQGFQPVCGCNYGAKRYDRVISSCWFCGKLITGLLILFSILGAIFAPEIITLFRSDDPFVIEMGAAALRFQCITVPFMGLVILTNMMLQTIGKAFRASFIAVARSGLFLIPSIILLTRFFGILGLEIAQMTADALTAMLAIPLGLYTLYELKKMQIENL
jgi:putative MATE family efflux protein